jgi:hypothetical protein
VPNQFSNPWKTKEINFLKEHITKLTYKQMATIIGRSPNAIQSKIRSLPIQGKIYKHDVNSNFFKTWSPEMTYVLGFIGADGNICHSGRAHALHIACDDRDVIEKIKLILSYEGPIYQKPRDNGKISYSLRICDQIIFADLERLGITERKSLTFTPPKIPKHLIRHFIRGYFDGDGSVSLRNPHHYKSRLVVNFYTASKPMSEFLYQQLGTILKNSLKGKVLIRLTYQKNPFYRINLGHKSSIKLFNYMYKNVNLFMERKYKKFIEGLNYGN